NGEPTPRARAGEGRPGRARPLRARAHPPFHRRPAPGRRADAGDLARRAAPIGRVALPPTRVARHGRAQPRLPSHARQRATPCTRSGRRTFAHGRARRRSAHRRRLAPARARGGRGSARAVSHRRAPALLRRPRADGDRGAAARAARDGAHAAQARIAGGARALARFAVRLAPRGAHGTTSVSVTLLTAAMVWNVASVYPTNWQYTCISSGAC